MAKNSFDYNKNKIELEAIVLKIKDESVGIDELIELYKQADKLIKSLKDYLKQAKNTLEHIK